MIMQEQQQRAGTAGGDLAVVWSGANGNCAAPVLPSFPAETRTILRQRGRSVVSSGRAGARQWILEFEPHSRQEPEPLMGWISGKDPLRQVRLTFPTREAALAYAQRQGLHVSMVEPQLTLETAKPRGKVGVEPCEPWLHFAWDYAHRATASLDAALFGLDGKAANTEAAATTQVGDRDATLAA